MWNATNQISSWMFPILYIFHLVSILYLVQLMVQCVQLVVRVVTGNLIHPIVLFCHYILGIKAVSSFLIALAFIYFLCLTLYTEGNALPNKQYLYHEKLRTYSLFIISCLWVNETYNPYVEESLWLRFVFNLGISLSQYIVFVRYGGVYTIFKLYPEGFGAGFNIYYRGWRVIGLDWHQWQVRQDLKTGKPLFPKDQFLINRPHIDLPLIDLHHWPWQKRHIKVDIEKLKVEKRVMREEKEKRRLEKKRRREERLNGRLNVPDDKTSNIVDHGKPSDESDLSDALSALLT